MKIRVIPYVYDSFIRDYVTIPLDDAEANIIQLARRVHGKDITAKDFRALLKELDIADDGPTGFEMQTDH